ncbi:UDP-glucose 4-epimerase GalE [Enterobacter hormaechei]|uniref:UDP-glucose 4-epimerase GalE n=1 Tax=Enterobacter hormaechei TaxID=158836 RepID=UPI000F8305A7|nr:UDP-glucose 4-epimerase GalE [Enterobacter hormaechei]RTO32135.1 UDP-glucose 4-epimerase GalE [Enterobacter hormaechei]
MSILLTGGLGYIGSHTAVTLIEKGYDIIIFDNLSNSDIEMVDRIKKITNANFSFIKGDVRDENDLKQVFRAGNISHVIHFAGLKSVGESSSNPLDYFQVNVIGTFNLLKVMIDSNVSNLIFSSSATVYGNPESIPLNEGCRTGNISNPYGNTKFVTEIMLKDALKAYPNMKITLLRYFNPIGAHPSALIGEKPTGIPNNLVPYLAKVATGELDCLSIFGRDYDTNDGTGVRDFIHVMDLAEGHAAVIDKNDTLDNFNVFNLGTGVGYSVLELIKTFESISGKKINYKYVERRPGDVGECWSNPLLAYQKLDWKAKRNLKEMLLDAWRWEMKGTIAK